MYIIVVLIFLLISVIEYFTFVTSYLLCVKNTTRAYSAQQYRARLLKGLNIIKHKPKRVRPEKAQAADP